LRVAFLGPAGTYTEEALRASSPAGDVQELPYPTVYEAVMAVQDGEADRAIVPIENSLEGGVAATLDALAGEAERVRIAAEVIHPIHHCVVAPRELPLGEVEQVVSHPQATAQCSHFLRERLPQAQLVTATSTSEAVRQVRDSDAASVALASRLAAELYGCRVLAADVEDRPDNETRFVWLTPAGERVDPGPNAKTSIVFWGFNDESPGALVEVLREFSSRGINLTKIESRPRRVRLGHYMFFADLEGAAEAPPVDDALAALHEKVETIRVLGSYPAAT
jgi:prephenate dehydratase